MPDTGLTPFAREFRERHDIAEVANLPERRVSFDGPGDERPPNFPRPSAARSIRGDRYLLAFDDLPERS